MPATGLHANYAWKLIKFQTDALERTKHLRSGSDSRTTVASCAYCRRRRVHLVAGAVLTVVSETRKMYQSQLEINKGKNQELVMTSWLGNVAKKKEGP